MLGIDVLKQCKSEAKRGIKHDFQLFHTIQWCFSYAASRLFFALYEKQILTKCAPLTDIGMV